MIITQTPLRISFFGGGTDYPEYFLQHGGAVLATAIDKSSFFYVSRFYSEFFDYNIRISYRQIETVNSVDEIQHAPYREAMRKMGITSHVEIDHTAELPGYTGLGSSSTFVVGLLNSLYLYQGKQVAPLDLAYEAIDLERNILKESVGCQDQTLAAVGGFNLIEFHALDRIDIHPLPISPERIAELEAHLMVFFTGIQRRAQQIIPHQVRNIDRNLEQLAEMRHMVDEGVAVLVNGHPLDTFGTLLNRSWQHKRRLSDYISNPPIDTIYSDGLEAGALGGKLLGAGGGGFILFYAPIEKQEAIRKKLAYLKEVPVKLNAPGTHVLLS